MATAVRAVGSGRVLKGGLTAPAQGVQRPNELWVAKEIPAYFTGKVTEPAAFVF